MTAGKKLSSFCIFCLTREWRGRGSSLCLLLSRGSVKYRRSLWGGGRLVCVMDQAGDASPGLCLSEPSPNSSALLLWHCPDTLLAMNQHRMWASYDIKEQIFLKLRYASCFVTCFRAGCFNKRVAHQTEKHPELSTFKKSKIVHNLYQDPMQLKSGIFSPVLISSYNEGQQSSSVVNIMCSDILAVGDLC